MAWSDAFIDGLSSRALSIVFRLRIRQQFDEPAVEPGDYVIYSVPGMGEEDLTIVDLSVEGASLRSREWSTTTGGIEVRIGGRGSGRMLCRRALRGAVIELEASIGGDYETIAVGQLDGSALEWRGLWVLRAASLLGALRARLSTDVDRSQLFYLAASDGVTYPTGTPFWLPGDSTLTVDDTAGFQYMTDSTSGGTTGALLCQVSSGEPFILTYTGTTATTFTGVTSGIMGTTGLPLPAVPSAEDIKIKSVAYLNGHPIQVALKILVSTGATGAHGSLDEFPAEWGLGLPQRLIDVVDSAHHRQLTGTTTWTSIVDEAVEDAGAWLREWLAPGGFFLTVRQGLITVRAAFNPDSPMVADSFQIGDDDLLELPEWDSYDDDAEAEYQTVTVYGVAVAGTSYTPKSLPCLYDPIVDQSGRLFSGETTEAERVMEHLGPYYTRVAEVYTVVVPLPFARLTPGDWGQLHFTAPSRRAGVASLDGRRAMVASVDVEWMSGRVTLRLMAFPPDEVM